MASIIKRGKSYSVVHYEGEGKDRHQVWESGLSYSAAKTRKVQLEMEEANNTHIDQNNITVSEFLHEFCRSMGRKSGWPPLTTATRDCWRTMSTPI